MPEKAREPYDPKKRLQETMDKLQEGVKEVFESGRYEEYLRVMSRFHRYSINNTMLIAFQRPDASYVAGYNAWQDKFGRHVKKGEKGIDIIAPVKRKITVEETVLDENGNPIWNKDGSFKVNKVEKTINSYKVSKVFDISQTEGKDLPTLGVDELVGSVDHYEDVVAAIEKASPCPVVFTDIPSGAKGYFRPTKEDKHIAIQQGMSQAQTVKTMLHELSHARMHDVTQIEDPNDRPDQSTREVQAESTAFVVAEHYHLDTGDYSFGYVAGWSDGKEITELKASLQQIKDCADGIIKDLDRNLEEIQKQREESIDSMAFFVPERGYLDIHRNAENQWDYTLYATDFTEIDGGIIEADIPIPQAVDDICSLQDLDFDSLQAVESDALADRVEQSATSAYMRSMAKAAPKDVSLVQRTNQHLRKPQQHNSHQHHNEQRPPWEEQEKPKPKHHDMER